MTSPARNRRKGAEWEIDLMKNLRKEGFDIERLRLAGKDDEGDLAVRSYAGNGLLVVEAKNAAAFTPAAFVEEAIFEAGNYAKHRELDRALVMPVAIVKRRNRSWTDAYVLTTVKEFFHL